jgi:cephalosporin-C deacetylase
MPYFDVPLEDLRTYKPAVAEPEGFDSFWASTLGGARNVEGDVSITPIDTRMTSFDSFDVTFPGFAGERIRAWLTLPAQASGPGPCSREL